MKHTKIILVAYVLRITRALPLRVTVILYTAAATNRILDGGLAAILFWPG